MNVVTFHVKERGLINLTHRVGTLFNRFGWTAGKMDTALRVYMDTATRHGCYPTFPVTTVALKRNPAVIQRLRDRGAELAVHGFVHTDYALHSFESQLKHFERAAEVFKQAGISFTGFRCPYYRWNEATWEAAAAFGFDYTSNRVRHWDVVDASSVNDHERETYAKAIELYASEPADDKVLLPYFQNGLVELPASIPDDEALVERLVIETPEEKSLIWARMLDAIHERGEMFVLSLHPERIYHCQAALDSTLARARSLTPSVWIATLGELAAWWRKRQAATTEVEHEGGASYRVRVSQLKDATVLVRGVAVTAPAKQWEGGFNLVDAQEFRVTSDLDPAVGIPVDAPASLEAFLKSEGYAVRRTSTPAAHGVFVPSAEATTEPERRALLDRLATEKGPVVRLGRWPNGAKSALAVSGDIDSLTLGDFARRPLEV